MKRITWKEYKENTLNTLKEVAEKKLDFDMNYFRNDCGSPSCVQGHIAVSDWWRELGGKPNDFGCAIALNKGDYFDISDCPGGIISDYEDNKEVVDRFIEFCFQPTSKEATYTVNETIKFIEHL